MFLDSNHTHAHVLSELKAYTPLVSIGSYCVVFDTHVEKMPSEFAKNRPWGLGDNPKTAVIEYLKEYDNFVVDNDIKNKILITAASNDFLKGVK